MGLELDPLAQFLSLSNTPSLIIDYQFYVIIVYQYCYLFLSISKALYSIGDIIDMH